MKEMRIDKTVMRARSFEQLDRDNLFPENVSLEQRLRLAFHLVCTIYGIKDGDSLKIDRTIFSAHKFK